MDLLTIIVSENSDLYTFALSSKERQKWPSGRPRIVIAKESPDENISNFGDLQLMTIAAI